MNIRSFQKSPDTVGIDGIASDVRPYLGWLDGPSATFVAETTAGAENAGLVIVRYQPEQSGSRGICQLYLRVAKGYRRQGVGSALLEKVLDFRQEWDARRLWTTFPIEGADPSGSAFYRKHGFAAWGRNAHSHVDLETFDPEPFAERAQALQERYGIRFVTADEVAAGDEEIAIRKLYELESVTRPDIPPGDSVTGPFEPWRKARREIPRFLEEMLVAVIDDQWIAATGLVSHRYTGVLREWRGQGLATALKAEALRRAKERGDQRLDTHNSEWNGPMLSVNRKLGYVPDPVWESYRRDF